MSQNSDPQESESQSSLSIVFDSSSDQSHTFENIRPESDTNLHQNDLITFETQKTGPNSTDVDINNKKSEINLSSIGQPEQTIDSSSSSINIFDSSSEENGQEEIDDQNQLIQVKQKEKNGQTPQQITDKEILEKNCRDDEQYVENIYQKAQNYLKLIEEGKDGVEMQKLQQALKDLQECDRYFGKQPFYKNQHDQIVNQVKIMLLKEENALNTLQMQNVDQFYKKLTLLNQFILLDIQISVQFDQLVKKFHNSILMVVNTIYTQINTSRVEQTICYLDLYFITLNKLQNITIVQQQINSVIHTLLNKLENYFCLCEQQLFQDYIKSDFVQIEQFVADSQCILKVLIQLTNISGNQQQIQTLKDQSNFIIRKWVNTDGEQLTQFKQKITEEQSLYELNNISLKLFILKQIDCFRDQQKYHYTYDKCNKNIQQLTNNYTEQLNVQLNQQQFDQVQFYINMLNKDSSMIQFISTNIQKAFEQIVSDNLRFINEKINALKHFFNKEYLIAILAQLQSIYSIQFIKTANGQFILNFQECATYINRYISEIYNIILQFTKFEQIQQLIQQFSYFHLVQQMQNIQNIQETMCSYKILLNNQKFNQLYQTLDTQMLQITQQIEQQLKQSLIVIKQVKLESLKEAGILHQIQQLKDASQLDIKYQQVYTKSIEILKQELSNQIQILENECIFDELEFNELETNIQQLPQEISLELYDQLLKIKQQIQQQLQNYTSQMIYGQDIKQLVLNFVENTNNKQYLISLKIQQAIKEFVDSTFKYCRDCINSKQFSKLFSVLSDIWDDLLKYQNQLLYLNNKWKLLRPKLREVCNDNVVKFQCDIYF
ncbi:Hypothetical_protein [Hexamita inflata]|uniref:Hypothetical_protein n=1 Tax=Hexamita inflata TaxID=28002 RepID=A0AA86RNC6_9EUKA|nr:Hypothetical protein HINF_LOCUS65623 [Hexamita inflata]